MQTDILSYDKYLVQFSGGKDSSAVFLYLLEEGVSLNKIELWHQDIDGCGVAFFDWKITRNYCRCFAHAFGVPLYLQWKEGGFQRELLRKNARTDPTCFELTDGTVACSGGKRGNPGTRMKFPQLSGSLRTRWCSAYLKIDVCTAAIVNQSRFKGCRTLVLSGERGEESPQRARYAIWERDPSDLRESLKNARLVDRHRPIRDWPEKKVWAILEKYRIRVHPCYYMGWSRCSCLFCIFGNADQYASAACIEPLRMQQLIDLEQVLGCTVKRNKTLLDLCKTGRPYAAIDEQLRVLSSQEYYDLPVIMPSREKWILPAGAFAKK